MELHEELKHRRRRFVERLEAIASPLDLLEFQQALADELKECERARKKDRDDDCTWWHMHLLRCLGDTLAWRLLHSHTIRQLAKNTGHPPYLTDQGDAFDHTLEVATDIAKEGRPVLIADLTHCLRIGDLVVPTDPEEPELIECKRSGRAKAFSLQGRRGRQIARMEKTLEYLKNGYGKVFGEDKNQMAVTIDAEVRYNWPIVNELCLIALADGYASKAISASELIYVSRDTEEFVPPPEITEGQFRPKKCFVAVHLVTVEKAWSSVPPPLNWNVDQEVRLALLEGDLMLVHLFDPYGLIGYETSKGKIVDFYETSNVRDDHGYIISAGDQQLMATSNLTDQILYGFETAESLAERMIAFIAETLGLAAIKNLGNDS